MSFVIGTDFHSASEVWIINFQFCFCCSECGGVDHTWWKYPFRACVCLCTWGLCPSVLNTYGVSEYFGFDSWWLLHAFSAWRYLPGMCVGAPAKALSVAKGSQRSKLPPPAHLPTPNLSTSPLTLQPRCGAGPARSSANRHEPVLHNPPPLPHPPRSLPFPPTSSFHMCIHIRKLSTLNLPLYSQWYPDPHLNTVVWPTIGLHCTFASATLKFSFAHLIAAAAFYYICCEWLTSLISNITWKQTRPSCLTQRS